MKKNIKNYLIVVIFIIFFIIPPLLESQKIPSSQRSRRIIQKIKPGLEKEFTNKKINWGSPIFVRIFKMERQLEVWMKKNKFFLFKKYSVCTYGNGSLGPKIREGEGQAPEGFYYVTPDKLNPVSSFHLSFNIGCPNQYNRGHKRTGGLIMVHGSCLSI